MRPVRPLPSLQMQERLAAAFARGDLAPPAYLESFSHLAHDIFHRYHEVLGDEDFERLFGGPPQAATGFIDPEAFARAHGLR